MYGRRGWEFSGNSEFNCEIFIAPSSFAQLAHPLCAKRRRGGLMFCCCFFIFIHVLVIFVRPIILTSRPIGPIFTKFAGLVELWPQMNDLKLCFSVPQWTLMQQTILWAKSTSDTHLVVCVTFARAAPPAYDKKYSCYAGRMQPNYLIR